MTKWLKRRIVVEVSISFNYCSGTNHFICLVGAFFLVVVWFMLILLGGFYVFALLIFVILLEELRCILVKIGIEESYCYCFYSTRCIANLESNKSGHSFVVRWVRCVLVDTFKHKCGHVPMCHKEYHPKLISMPLFTF